jgi:hypothetical protein
MDITVFNDGATTLSEPQHHASVVVMRSDPTSLPAGGSANGQHIPESGRNRRIKSPIANPQSPINPQSAINESAIATPALQSSSRIWQT